MIRLRTRLIPVLLAALVPACGIAPAHAATPRSYYVALGDSLAYGVTAPGVPTDPTCQSPTAPGYVCLVYGYAKQLNPSLQLQNFAVAEADSCVLVHGYGSGSPCTNAPTGGVAPSQLQTAVDFIKAHTGQVGPVTVNVGGADLIPLLPASLIDPSGTAAKLPGLFRAFAANLDATLQQLRAADPQVQIILVTQYNPLGGIGSPPLPTGLPDIAKGAINALNRDMKLEAAKYSATIADVAAVFDANPQGAAVLTFVPTSLASGDPSKIDIFPTVDGYRLYAQTVLKVAGFTAPLKVFTKLSKKTLRTRASLTVHGTTIASADVQLHLTLPHKKSATATARADDNGAYTLKIKVGKYAGKGTVRVCATDFVTGGSKCGAKTSFTIR